MQYAYEPHLDGALTSMAMDASLPFLRQPIDGQMAAEVATSTLRTMPRVPMCAHGAG